MSISTTDRFWEKVAKQHDGCWEWTASRDNKGYGLFSIGSRTDGSRRVVRAHRWAYAEYHDVDVDDMECVRHKCDNPPCVNPAHLEDGTHADNMQDMVDRGRASRRPGSKSPRARLTEQDVRIIRDLQPVVYPGVLAEWFGVSKRTIGSIQGRETWKHVD